MALWGMRRLRLWVVVAVAAQLLALLAIAWFTSTTTTRSGSSSSSSLGAPARLERLRAVTVAWNVAASEPEVATAAPTGSRSPTADTPSNPTSSTGILANKAGPLNLQGPSAPSPSPSAAPTSQKTTEAFKSVATRAGDDPLGSRIAHICGSLYASPEFRAATGAPNASVPHAITVVATNDNGLADNILGAVGLLMWATAFDRRFYANLSYYDATYHNEDGLTVPVWDRPGSVSDPAIIPTVRCGGGNEVCLHWVSNSEAGRYLPYGSAKVDPFANYTSVLVRMNRGLILSGLRSSASYLSHWHVAHGLSQLTAFGCYHHALFRVHGEVIAQHRSLSTALGDRTRHAIGLHYRSGDRIMLDGEGKMAPEDRRRHRAMFYAMLGCAIWHNTKVEEDRDPPETTAGRAQHRSLFVLATSDSSIFRREARAFQERDGIKVQLVTNADAQHVHRQRKEPNAVYVAAIEHWALARTSIIVKNSESGFSTTAAFAGFHETVLMAILAAANTLCTVRSSASVSGQSPSDI